MLLAVDTSTRYAGVALYGASRNGTGQIFFSHSWYSTQNHTAELMPAVSLILKSQNLAVDDLRGVTVALGPGGFSALRVGMSVAKGLALTTGIPLAGVGTLDLEAYPYLNSGVPVCAILDAGRSEVASALFGPDGQRTREDMICPAADLVDAIQGEVLFCGEGVINWGELIRERLGAGGVVMTPRPSWRLWSLSELGWQRLEEDDVSDLASLQPTYLRMPSIGGPKQRDRKPQRS